MAQSVEQPSGLLAPRQYLTTHLSPSLKNGMVQACRAQPDNVLRYLGEYLIAQSIRGDPSQNADIIQHFLYDHSDPQPTAPLIQGPAQNIAPNNGAGNEMTTTAAQSSLNHGDTDLKMEIDGQATGTGDNDQIMTDENANGATEDVPQQLESAPS